MGIENHKVDLQAKPRKSMMSDRNYLIRNQPKPKYLTHDIVAKFVKDNVVEEDIKEKLLEKLKKCPDGALQNFIDNIEKKIEIILQEMAPKSDKQTLQKSCKEITIEDMISMRNRLSEESIKEFENEQPQG